MLVFIYVMSFQNQLYLCILYDAYKLYNLWARIKQNHWNTLPGIGGNK